MAEKLIAVRLDEKQVDKLTKMTEATGLDQSKIIRILIDNAKYTPAKFASELSLPKKELAVGVEILAA